MSLTGAANSGPQITGLPAARDASRNNAFAGRSQMVSVRTSEATTKFSEFNDGYTTGETVHATPLLADTSANVLPHPTSWSLPEHQRRSLFGANDREPASIAAQHGLPALGSRGSDGRAQRDNVTPIDATSYEAAALLYDTVTSHIQNFFPLGTGESAGAWAGCNRTRQQTDATGAGAPDYNQTDREQSKPNAERGEGSNRLYATLHHQGQQGKRTIKATAAPGGTFRSSRPNPQQCSEQLRQAAHSCRPAAGGSTIADPRPSSRLPLPESQAVLGGTRQPAGGASRTAPPSAHGSNATTLLRGSRQNKLPWPPRSTLVPNQTLPKGGASASTLQQLPADHDFIDEGAGPTARRGWHEQSSDSSTPPLAWSAKDFFLEQRQLLQQQQQQQQQRGWPKPPPSASTIPPEVEQISSYVDYNYQYNQLHQGATSRTSTASTTGAGAGEHQHPQEISYRGHLLPPWSHTDGPQARNISA
ncbi:unnamed protein product, partial [Amoebophrya sp. A25]|eukprot:GSA25T00012072001.1